MLTQSISQTVHTEHSICVHIATTIAAEVGVGGTINRVAGRDGFLRATGAGTGASAAAAVGGGDAGDNGNYKHSNRNAGRDLECTAIEKLTMFVIKNGDGEQTNAWQ